MKRLFITLSFIVISIVTALAKNHNFSYGGLYYKWDGSGNSHPVMVTYPQYSNSGDYYDTWTKPTGNIEIPISFVLSGVSYEESYSVTKIGDHAFCGCNGLSSVTIINGISSIGDGAFSNCSSLTSIIIPASVKSIGGGVFSNCRSLDSIYIPNTVSSFIGNGMFSGCSSLKSVTIPNTTTSIGSNMFKDCSSLDSITIPNSVTEIGENAFSGCIGLKEITIPDAVTNIEKGAFLNCSNLKTINIPNTVQFIGSTTFNGCNSLQYNEFDNALYLGNEENEYLWLIKAKSTNITSCEINRNCKHIANNAFDGCSSLTSINIPNTVINIGSNAFANCSSLTQVTLPESILSIGSNVFNNSNITIYCEPASQPSNWYSNSSNDWHNKKGSVIWGIKATISNDYVFNAIDASLRLSAVYKYTGSAIDLIIPASAYFDGIEYSVSSICNNAFDGYTFHSITIESTTPPILSNANTFQSYIPINIPCGSLENYQSANIWSELNLKTTLKYSFEFSSADTEKGDVEVLREPTCEKSAIITANAQTGFAFEKWSDGYKANPRYLTVTQDTFLVAYFVVDRIDAKITLANPEQGIVSNSSGIYHYNEEIEISATAKHGYTFAKWSDGVTTNPRTVVLKKDTVIKAEFSVNKYTITLKTNKAERGSVSGGGTFYYLSQNRISAETNYGYHFLKWSDNITANPRNISLTRDTILTAVFEPNNYNLLVSSNNTDFGSVTGGGTYGYLSKNDISALPNYGYHLEKWSDGVTDLSRTITITKDTVIKAEFAVNQYKITLQTNIAERGTVSGNGSFNYLTNNKITATPNYGYVFEKWSDGNTDNPRTVALTKDTAFTAVFVQKDFTLSATSANTALGSVTGSGTIKYKETAEITATATAAHHHFVAWSDGNRQNPRTVQVVSDTQFVATFAIDSFTVAATSRTEEFGAVSGSGLYAYGTAVEVKAQPQPHCHFVEWSNGASGLVQQFDVKKDTAFNAAFAIDTHSLQATVADSTMGVATGSGTYDYGTAVTLTATAAAGCYFTGWSDGVTTNPRIITIESDTTVVANFEQMLEFSITVVPSDTARGTVSGSGKYVSGTEATLSAIPRQHYLFSQWSDGRTDNPRTVRVIADATYKAVFVPEQYNVVLSQNNADMGMVSGSGVYSYGDMVSCLAKPYQNYHFVQWSNGETANPYEFLISDNQILTAYFAAGAVTAIEDDAAAEPIIYAVGKTIIVENATNEILVYDAMGKLICRDAILCIRAEITVNTAGVYIVKTGNAVMRVAVE